jgi:hypothetical protein
MNIAAPAQIRSWHFLHIASQAPCPQLVEADIGLECGNAGK